MPRLLVGVVVAVVATAGFAGPAYAGGARSFVAGSGTDVGTCERQAPCRTFAYAITQTDAKGEIVATESAGYGAVTITNAISLIGAPGVHAAIAPSSGDAITINAGTSDQVVLRNLYLNGSKGAGNGVVYNSAGAVVVEDCVIANFAFLGIVRGVTTSDAAQLTVSDTVLRRNRAGLLLADGGSGSIDAQIDHTRAALNGGGAGFAIGTNARATITDSIATQNGSIGFSVGGGGRLFLERDTTSGNHTGIGAAGPASRAVVSNSTIVDNILGLDAVGGAQLVSRVNNTLFDNAADGAFTSTIPAAYHTTQGGRR